MYIHILIHSDGHTQVGVTPAMIERPRDHCKRVGSFALPDRPLTVCPPEADPKWRYFWRVVSLDARTQLALSLPPSHTHSHQPMCVDSMEWPTNATHEMK